SVPCCASARPPRRWTAGARMSAAAPSSSTATRRNLERSPLPRRADLMKQHRARKRFGQHFLSDSAIIDAIVREIDPRPGDPMVEIGPGLAALTQPLVERLGRLTVIELDRDLAARLRAHPQLDVIESDVLKVDFGQIQQARAATKIRVCGNLPYNISSPILFHLLPFAALIEDQHFMLQKEVID